MNMSKRPFAKINVLAVTVTACFLLLAAIIAIFTVPALRAAAGLDPKGPADDDEGGSLTKGPTQVIRDAKGRPGLRLTKAAVNGLQIKPVPVSAAMKARTLPPQVGTINFDNETLFPIPSRFPGEIAEIREVEEVVPPDPLNPSLAGRLEKRPLRYGDRVKQGWLLAVVHSTTLGTAKAALVDAVCSLKLSTETLERHYKLFAEGSIALATLRQSERQVQADSNTLLTAERTLITMKLTDEEVEEVKQEAEKIAKLASEGLIKRNAREEAERWARVEVRVPWFDKAHPDRELVIVEKNKSLYAMVDPIATSTPLFTVADLSRVQVWVHPAEEYLPLFRKLLDHPERGGAMWSIIVPAYPDDKLPPTRFYQVAPSLEPFQHAPMIMGYLNNPNGSRYVVGQFVTATIELPPEPDTVEVPSQAINEIGGEALVFVQPDPNKNEFISHRVAAVHRFKDVTIVRTKLTKVEEEDNARNAKLADPKRPIETLQPGDLVVTRGVVELTAELESQLLQESNK
jgi:cobalt-zinc-cadmium efflux system membrane fusion protein